MNRENKITLTQWIIFFIILGIIIVPEAWVLAKFHVSKSGIWMISFCIGMLMMMLSRWIANKIIK